MYRGCLLRLLLGIVFLTSLGLVFDCRRALGRYIYVRAGNSAATFVLKPQENSKLVLSIYEDSISPANISNHCPVAQYSNFQDEYISDAFYCGFRDSIGNDNMYVWVRPYAKEIYAHDTDYLHFRDHILPPDSTRPNVFDVDLNLGFSIVKVEPNKADGLHVVELPWYKIILNQCSNRLAWH